MTPYYNLEPGCSMAAEKKEDQMAIGKEIGDFALKITSVTYGETSDQVNVHGPATGFGTVQGTLTFRGEAGAKHGKCGFRGRSYLDNGETLDVTADGTWETVGKHKWHLRLLNVTSDGRTIYREWLTLRWLKGISSSVSSGNLTDELIQKYIEEQEGEPLIDDSRFTIDS